MNIEIVGSIGYVDDDPVLYQFMKREHFPVRGNIFVSDDMWEEFVKSHQDRFADEASEIASGMWESFTENFQPTKSKDFKKSWIEILKEEKLQ